MKASSTDPVRWAFEVLSAHFEHREPHFDVSELLTQSAACFVSLHTKEGILRGCIGTIYPARKNLKEEIHANALSAAFHDPRFEPLRMEELSNLDISVDILNEPEEIDNLSLLNPKAYGIIVEDGFRRGVLLPDLPGIRTAAEQVRIACHKAGILHHKPKRIYRFTVNRYH